MMMMTMLACLIPGMTVVLTLALILVSAITVPISSSGYLYHVVIAAILLIFLLHWYHDGFVGIMFIISAPILLSFRLSLISRQRGLREPRIQGVEPPLRSSRNAVASSNLDMGFLQARIPTVPLAPSLDQLPHADCLEARPYRAI